MSQPIDTERLLALRKVTRVISELLETELGDHLRTLSPLVQPRKVFGRHLAGGPKQAVRGESEAFEELRSLYRGLAETKPFQLPMDIESPLEIVQASLEITPAEVAYTANIEQETRSVTLIPPLKWVLSFSGFGPQRLERLIRAQKKATGDELQQCVLHYLVMQVTLSRLPGLLRILEGLRFPIISGETEQFGKLPITFIECAVPTMRPPDEIIIQSTEISGTPTFEEVVDVDRIVSLQDPLQSRLLDLVRQHAAELLPDAATT